MFSYKVYVQKVVKAKFTILISYLMVMIVNESINITHN